MNNEEKYIWRRILRNIHLTLIIVIIIICITFLLSLTTYFNEIKSADCMRIHAPLGGINLIGKCPDTSQGPVTPSSKNITNSFTRVKADNMTIYTTGSWSVIGSIMGNFAEAKAMFRNDSSYGISGNIFSSGKDYLFSYSGLYKIDSKRSIIFLTTNQGTQSVYLIDNIKNDSFSLFNSNTYEYYNFIRIAKAQ